MDLTHLLAGKHIKGPPTSIFVLQMQIFAKVVSLEKYIEFRLKLVKIPEIMALGKMAL